ncbi:cobalamin-binding protein [Streptomyces sp. WAC 04229]|uniref:cobalamin B12-binding domain-containing protein n=1 Tax=Streptomyces sp. WAC 04229 TaxID=2203206 RepID=UPI000F74B13C|nr:cobalamin-dependent protein [Streptomyces sp. WAC 04229]RSN46951.1 cobalamin-binding protein [Streptomyces sp. WAC 04229]
MTGAELDALRDDLWQAVVGGDEGAALALVRQVRTSRADPETLLVDVVADIQRRIGAAWAEGRLTVAREHAATAINDRVVTLLTTPDERAEPAPQRGRVVVACVEGEWHALPARLVTEVLRLRGWRVDFLGAQTPARNLVNHLHRCTADAVLLSSSLPTRLPAAHGAVTACQAVGTPVLTGGAAFGPDGRYARLLGADGWAPGAREAADVLAAGLERPANAAARHPVDDLPHLADQEYALVTRARPRLVKQTFADLSDRLPAVRRYDDEQRDRTAEGLAHTVDFLAAALYVDDAELFTGFLTWTADILTARGVPGHSLLPALASLGEQLHGCPRARRLLDEGALALEAPRAR